MLRDAVLRFPQMYTFFQWINGADRMRRIYVKEYMRLADRESILDIACGTADILPYVGEHPYTGVDLSESYIAFDQKRYRKKTNARFVQADVNDFLQRERKQFDLILLMGIMHHLDDAELRNCLAALKAQIDICGGRLVTLDGVYQPELNRLERALLNGDRGRHIRTLPEYLAIVLDYFPDCKYEIRKDLYFLPYNVLIFHT